MNVPKGGMVCVGTAADAGVGGNVRAVARILQQGHDVAISLLLSFKIGVNFQQLNV
jgi:hypothetical protein